MRPIPIALVAALSLASISAWAQVHGGAGGHSASGTGAGQALFTARGPYVTTGRIGNMQTMTLPGGGGGGFVMNNGNGTSTLIGPGFSTIVPTPR